VNYEELRTQYDTGDYYTALIKFPEHVLNALKQMESFKFNFKPKSILICGMGGSAIPGHLLKDYCITKLNIPVVVESNYDLPLWANKETLVILISYSGNTEETLSCLKQVIDKNLKTVLIASGGYLEKAAIKYGFPFIKAPGSFQPRAATPYLFTYVLEIMRKCGLIFPNYEQAIKELNSMDYRIEKRNEAKDIAEKLMNKYVYIHVPKHLESIGIRYQAQDFNENAKTLAKYSIIPEANHNELSAWSECQTLAYTSILIWDNNMSEPIKKRMLFLESVLKGKSEITWIKSRCDDLLATLMTLVHTGDMISYYLSLLRNKNPLPVNVVEELKKFIETKTTTKNDLIKSLGL